MLHSTLSSAQSHFHTLITARRLRPGAAAVVAACCCWRMAMTLITTAMNNRNIIHHIQFDAIFPHPIESSSGWLHSRPPLRRRGREWRRPDKNRLPQKWLHQTFLLPSFFVIPIGWKLRWMNWFSQHSTIVSVINLVQRKVNCIIIRSTRVLALHYLSWPTSSFSYLGPT